jgi:hypothetical protein
MRIAKSKHDYQKYISTYLQRREIIRKKFNVINGNSACIEYHEAVKNINKKIQNWRKQIRRIKKREKLIKELDNKIIEFMGASVKNTIYKNDKISNISRFIFYKYGLESGINGILLSQYVGSKRKELAGNGRKRFNKSFIKNEYNKEIWYRFKEFINKYDKYKIAA